VTIGSMNAAVPVIALDHPAALDVARVGRTSATLAQGRAAGLPVGSGVVLTTDWRREDRATVEQIWRIISHDGARPLVVRASPVDGDGHAAGSGVLEPTHHARTAAELVEAIDRIREDAQYEPRVPVLVQPDRAAPWRGLLFEDDVRGRRRRQAVVVAHGGDAEDAWIAELDHVGRVRDVLAGWHLEHPPLEVLARLVRLADRVTAQLGGGHDIEWAIDRSGRPHLLRAQPSLCLRSGTDAPPWRLGPVLVASESAA
jgi:hypothetical protein